MRELAATSTNGSRSIISRFSAVFSDRQQRAELDRFKQFLEPTRGNNRFVLTDSCRNTVRELERRPLTKQAASRLIRAESILEFSLNARYAVGALIGYALLIPGPLTLTLKDTPKSNSVVLTTVLLAAVWVLGGIVSIGRYLRAARNFVDSLRELAPSLEVNQIETDRKDK